MWAAWFVKLIEIGLANSLSLPLTHVEQFADFGWATLTGLLPVASKSSRMIASGTTDKTHIQEVSHMSLHIDQNLVTHGDHELSVLFSTEQRREQAMLDGDVDALSKLLHPDAVYIHSSGIVDNEKTYIESLRMSDVNYRTIDVTVEHVRYLTSSVILLSGRAKMDTVQFSRNKLLDILFIMTWVRHPDGWKMSSWQSTPVSTP